MAITPIPIVKGTRYRMELLFPQGFLTIAHFETLALFLKTPSSATIVSQSLTTSSVSFVATKNATLNMGAVLCTVFGVPVTIGRISIESLPAKPSKA